MRVVLDVETGIATATLDPSSGVESIGVALRDVYAHPDYRFRMLWDCRNVDSSGLTTEDLRNLAEMTNRLRPDAPPGRGAILVARDIDFGLARMAIAFTEDRVPVAYQVFHEYDEAIRWLREEPDRP